MKLRALVVDDSRVMRNIVMQSLRNTGLAEFEFTEAEDGAAALVRFHPKHLDILFVDWNMPKMSGIDFVRSVRAQSGAAHIPIVMITSEKRMGHVEEALDDAGATLYITKPFTSEELRRKLTGVVSELEALRQEHAAGEPMGFFRKLVARG
jgi:two-component system chemotaxis response regulator CheY